MKSIETLDNAEKAKLLHELFPGEMPQFLNYLGEYCSYILSPESAELESGWTNGLVTFHFWKSLCGSIAEVLRSRGHDLRRSGKVFSDQLTYCYNMLVLNDQLVKYALTASENKRFKLAVRLLYGDLQGSFE